MAFSSGDRRLFLSRNGGDLIKPGAVSARRYEPKTKEKHPPCVNEVKIAFETFNADTDNRSLAGFSANAVGLLSLGDLA
jgi:hypothetical protein